MPFYKGEKYFMLLPFLRKIIQICLKIDATHYYDDDLLLRQEIQKKITCPGVWYDNN